MKTNFFVYGAFVTLIVACSSKPHGSVAAPVTKTSCHAPDIRPGLEIYGVSLKKGGRTRSVEVMEKLYYVDAKPFLTSADLLEVTEEPTDRRANPYASERTYLLKFNPAGSARLATETKRLQGLPVAIYLNGQLVSAPLVMDTIKGGEIAYQPPLEKRDSSQLGQFCKP